MKTMIALVGEQPIPNVVPIAHYQPDRLVLVYTSRTQTVAQRIANWFGSEKTDRLQLKNAYNLNEISEALGEKVKNISSHSLVFNVTGGTKPMSFAALDLARKLNCNTFYFQSEGNQYYIWDYSFSNETTKTGNPRPINVTLKIEEVLKLFVENYRPSQPKNEIEKMVLETLKEKLGDEYQVLGNVYLESIGPNVEIDWVICYKNNMAVGEVKKQAKKTEGIDQINSVTDQRTLGTYTKKFIVTGNKLHDNDQHLANAYGIHVILAPSLMTLPLSEDDKNTIVSEIRKVMEGSR